MASSFGYLSIFIVVSGFVTYWVGKPMGLNISLPMSFVVALAGAIASLVPTVGAPASLLAMVVAAHFLSPTGDVMDAFYTTIIARLAVVPGMLFAGYALY